MAKEQGIPLVGVEVIFYAKTEPFIGFRATPPWSAQEILAAPLADKLLEAIEEKEGAATVTPTPKPSTPPPGG